MTSLERNIKGMYCSTETEQEHRCIAHDQKNKIGNFVRDAVSRCDVKSSREKCKQFECQTRQHETSKFSGQIHRSKTFCRHIDVTGTKAQGEKYDIDSTRGFVPVFVCMNNCKFLDHRAFSL